MTTLSGSIIIREAVQAWQEQSSPTPVVILDLGAYRAEQITHLERLIWAEAARNLAEHPLAAWRVPDFPTVNLTISLPEVPALPELPELPDLTPLIRTTVNTGSKLAFAASLASFLFFAGPILILEGQKGVEYAYQHLPMANTQLAADVPIETTGNPDPTVRTDEEVFSLNIPSLDIHSTVVPNVDPGNKKEYSEALKKGIAHAAGTGLPDQTETNKTIYLFAHSTDATWNVARYNAQFYELKDIKEGEKIEVTFWGKTYEYQVESTHIVAADDVSYLEPQTEKEQLILQTCYPPGTAWKRLVVVATPVSK